MRIVEQLALVPLLLSAWGVERYGVWVALTSVATFAGLANFGIGQSAYSDIIIQWASGNRQAASRSFATSLALVMVISLFAAAILFIVVSMFDPSKYLSLGVFSHQEAVWTLLVFGWSVVVGFYIEPFSAVVGAARGAGIPNFLSGACKVAEIAAIMMALHFSAGPVAVATIILCSVTLNVLGNLLFAIRVAPWLSLSWAQFDRDAIARIWKAALGFFCISVCLNIVYVQAPRLIVFHGFGAAALASFTIFVTYTRAARNIVCMIPQSAQVELGRSFASGNIAQLRHMIENVNVTTVGVGAGALVIALLVSPIVIPIWTHGNVAVQWDLLIVLAAISLVGCYFDPLLVAVSAMNRVTLTSFSYATGLVIGICTSLLLPPSAGLAAIAGLCMMPAELGGAVAGRITVEKVVGRLDLCGTVLSLIRSRIPALLRR
jgi:O-antigen/teichoic acid export membrane protein